MATTSAARSPIRRRATLSRSLSNERAARSTGCGDGLSLASAAIQAPALRPNRRVGLQSDVVAVDAFGSLKKRFPAWPCLFDIYSHYGIDMTLIVR